MALSWIRENPPQWDADKARIVGAAPPGALDLPRFQPGAAVPGEWWRVEEDGAVVGYGWMDSTWEGGEMLLAVDPRHQRSGVGSFIIDRLRDEAAARGLAVLFNVVRPTHPERERVTHWLVSRGFQPTEGGELKLAVHPKR